MRQARWNQRWMSLGLVSCSLYILAVLPGCKGSYTPSGGTSVPTRTPTPVGTPSGTPIPDALVGTYVGTFSLPSFREISRRLTITVNGNGDAAATVALSGGGTLELDGFVSSESRTISLSGQAIEVGSNQEVTVTLEGRLNISQNDFVNGSGNIRTSQGDTGTWQAQRTQ